MNLELKKIVEHFVAFLALTRKRTSNTFRALAFDCCASVASLMCETSDCDFASCVFAVRSCCLSLEISNRQRMAQSNFEQGHPRQLQNGAATLHRWDKAAPYHPLPQPQQESSSLLLLGSQSIHLDSC